MYLCCLPVFLARIYSMYLCCLPVSPAAAPAEQPSEDEEREPEQRTVVVTKRFAPRGDCLIYRYGSFSTGIQIVGEFPII